MPVTNEILPFAPQATVELSEILSLADYTADMQRLRGNQPGIARLELVNTVLRQTSHMAAGLAQLIANRYDGGVKDDGDLDAVETGLQAAIGIISGAGRLQKSWTLSAAVAPGGTLTLPDSMRYVVGADVLMLACDGVILDKDNYSEVGTPGSLSSSVTLSFTAPSGSRMLAVLLATSGVGSSVSGGVSDETIAAINEAIARANAAAAAAETAAAAAGDPIYVTPTEANA